MLWVNHRINQISGLSAVSVANGCEIDLRSDLHRPGAIHLSHDPWVRGDDFSAWVAEFKRLGLRGPIILNTKEDGLEERVMDILAQAGVENWFFLDTALPTLVKHTKFNGRRKFAVRLSAHEPPQAIEPFRGAADWVWVDCFGGEPVAASWVASLKPGFKVCLVSPELQQADLPSRLSQFAELYKLADAVCTKKPDVWQEYFR